MIKVFSLSSNLAMKSNIKNNSRDIEYIRIAPFHILPNDCYRIENLGTGQVRLNYTLNQVWKELSWERTYPDFFAMFCDLATTHYARVMSDAKSRIKSIQEFKTNGYKYFKFTK